MLHVWDSSSAINKDLKSLGYKGSMTNACTTPDFKALLEVLEVPTNQKVVSLIFPLLFYFFVFMLFHLYLFLFVRWLF